MENQPKDSLGYEIDDAKEPSLIADATGTSDKQCHSRGLELAFRHVRQPSSGIDSFSVLPPIIDPMQEVMLDFYLRDGESYNASVNRMFKPTLKPYPHQERFQIALGLPSMFYSTIARATFHFLRKHMDADAVYRPKLERCGIRLRTEAINILGKWLAKPTLSQAELGDILAMATSLATLEQLHGTPEDAKIHQRAARQILTLIDEPFTGSQGKTLLWYECILAPESHSFFWDSFTVADRVKDLNIFFKEVGEKWKGGLIRRKYQHFRVCTGLPTSPFLEPDSRLYQMLSRSKERSALQDQSEERSHIFCVLLYAKTMMDLYASPQTVYMYKNRIEKSMQVKGLDESAALINLAWLMNTTTGVVAADDKRRRWHVATMINAMKFMPYTYRSSIISWLFRFIKGEAFDRPLHVDNYAFSYDALALAHASVIEV